MKSLSMNNLLPFLKSLGREYQVLVPYNVPAGNTVFLPLSPLREMELSRKVTGGTKFLLFPQTERTLSVMGDNVSLVTGSKKRFVFGLRPCDMRAINMTEQFMKRDGMPDPHFMAKRRETIFCVLACKSYLSDSCFCEEMGLSRYLEGGYDMQVVEVQDKLFFEANAEYEGLLKGDHFKDPSPDELRAHGELKKELSSAQKRAIDPSEITGALLKKQGEEGPYQELALRCIECGSCIYLCPTCTCFNVFDMVIKGEVLRYRTWDACLHEGFSKEASGHNPRPTRASRLKRRVEHKLLYDRKRYNAFGCVGCGRCHDSCPVGLGMMDIIKAFLPG